MRAALCLTLAATLLLASSARADVVYVAETDFSISPQPANGVWNYGYYDVTGTTYTQYTTSTASWHGNSNLSAWSQFLYDSNSYSVVGQNASGTVQNEVLNGSISIDPNSLFIHPGANGEKGTIRFTAPGDGTVNISALFSAADTVAGDRDVHVYINGVDQIPGNSVIGIKGSPTDVGYSSGVLSVTAGDLIDFAVGYGVGVNPNYFNDATMVAASVDFTAVPEPSSLALGGLAGVGLLLSARRRRKPRAMPAMEEAVIGAAT